MSVIAGRTAIRTQSGVIDARRSRSPQGALLEMAALEMERQRLLAESARMQRRGEQIVQRVDEIVRRQRRLQRFVDFGGSEVGTAEPLALPLPGAPARTTSTHRSRKLGY
jgi:hypothetical protein